MTERRLQDRDFCLADVLEIAKIAVTLALHEEGRPVRSSGAAMVAARALKFYLERKRGAGDGMDQGAAEAGDRKE